MSKEDLIMYKAIERGWNNNDIRRVFKKLKELAEEFGDELTIEFNQVEDLAVMLDEPIDYKLEWTLIRLCKDKKITFAKTAKNIYQIGIYPF